MRRPHKLLFLSGIQSNQILEENGTVLTRELYGFDDYFPLLKKYYLELGHCDVPADHPLFPFVISMRSKFFYKFGNDKENTFTVRRGRDTLTLERFKRLKSIVFLWIKPPKDCRIMTGAFVQVRLIVLFTFCISPILILLYSSPS